MATSMCALCLRRLQSLNTLSRKPLHLGGRLAIAFKSTEADSKDQTFVNVVDTEDDDEEDLINKMRDVSGLRGNLWKRNRNEIPEITSKYQQRRRYLGKLYGKFGENSGLDPKVFWPSRAKLREEVALERELEPSLQEMMANIEMKRQINIEKGAKKLARVQKNMAKMNQWIKEFEVKGEKMAEEQKQREAKRERLLAEAEEYFGYRISHRDPKFKELMEEKAKEEKKMRKKKKLENRDAKMRERVQKIAQESQS